MYMYTLLAYVHTVCIMLCTILLKGHWHCVYYLCRGWRWDGTVAFISIAPLLLLAVGRVPTPFHSHEGITLGSHAKRFAPIRGAVKGSQAREAINSKQSRTRKMSRPAHKIWEGVPKCHAINKIKTLKSSTRNILTRNDRIPSSIAATK